MISGRTFRGLAGPLLALLMLVVGPAATALASAEVRFVNARGGSDPVRLEVRVNGKTTSVGGTTPFGQAGQLVAVPSGMAKLSLTGGGSSAASAGTTAQLNDGDTYTIAAIPKGSKGYDFAVLRSGKAKAGMARLRVFHAAPELGKPDIRLGDRTIAQGVKFRTAAGYLTTEPGSYRLVVARPNGGKEVFGMRVSLAAGSATTVFVAGSGGSPTRLIQVEDGSVTPAGAPQTGLGGLAGGGGEPWLLALLAALLAGSVGGAAQFARARRTRP
jgi:hypothetical protein